MKKILTILCFFIYSFTKAGVFYISPTGNNINAGTQNAPWKTLLYASQNTISGDIIHVMAGTYTETITISLGVGVSIEGDGIGTTIIKSAITGQWSAFLMLESGSLTNGNQSISNITFDGQYVSESNLKTWMGVWIIRRSNVIIHDCKIINFYDRGVIYDGNGVSNPLQDPNIHATGNKFYNNQLLNCARNAGMYGAGCLNIGGQIGMEIYNNTIQQDQRVAFKNGWPIKYWENGFLRGGKISNNTLIKAPYPGTYPGDGGDWDFAIELFNIQGLEISYNNIQGSIDLNYNYKGTYAYSAWIHHNTLNHVPRNTHMESGMILEFATIGMKIEDNIINNYSAGIQFNTRGAGNSGGYTYPPPIGGYSALVDNIIRRNLFTNLYQPSFCCGGIGIGVFSEGTDDPYINGLEIYNNTLVALPGSAPFIGLDFTSMPNGNGSNISIHHNIVQGFQGAWLQGSNGNTHITGMTVTNNDAFGNGSNVPSWPGGNPVNYTYTGNLAVNPQFDANYNATNSTLVAAGIGYNGIPAPPVSCTSFTYGAWTVCDNTGHQTRTWTALPIGCIGTPPTDSINRTCAIQVNQPPVANAGADKIITLPTNTVILTGTGIDPDGTIVSYQWKRGTTILGNTATITLSGLTAGSLTYTLTVTDNQGATGSDNVNVTVNAAPPPIPGDTIYCTALIHFPTTGSNTVMRNITYIVKRAVDGFWYNSSGTRVEPILYRQNNKWFLIQ